MADGRRPHAELADRRSFFQFFLVDRKLADTFRQFVYRHRILVVLPQELGFGDTSRTRFNFAAKGQFTLDSAFAFRQLFQQGRSDSQAVTASQLQDLAEVAKLAPITTVS